MSKIDLEKEQIAAELKGSLLEFCKVFYPLLTSRDFIVSQPISRESHHITIARALTRAARLEIPSQRLLINVAPGAGKSLLLCMWTAWCIAQYPDSKFLYISYSKSLAGKHTETIKRIISLRHYKYLFDVSIRYDSKAKEHFQTTAGGAVMAAGSSGSITGFDAGSPGLSRFSGAVVVDDAHKVDEAHSETIRLGVIENYRETIQQRARGINVPFVYIGQRVHEDDLAAYLIAGKDGYEWEAIVLKSIDDAGNAMYPEAQPLEMLRIKEEKDPYVYASQYQQDPIPAGGGLFRPEWFVTLLDEPEMLCTFITADTAETNKSWNDATVFSFWGIYEIENFGKKTGEIALHWIDCMEIRVEPKDLKDAFIAFYTDCMRYKCAPRMAAIEKKSTGVTLVSVLSEFRGLSIREIERTKASGSKTQRFLEMQPIIASRLLSFTEGAKHYDMCVKHMSKITANDSHRSDDICFVANTKIATLFGDKNIQDITTEDLIVTPFGLGKITACGSTGFHKVIKRNGLAGTPNHPVFDKIGFFPFDTVSDAAIMRSLSYRKLIEWRYNQLLCSIMFDMSSWDRNGIILANHQIMKDGKGLKDCMSQFMNFIAKRQFRKAMWFIIKTVIILTTTSATWSVYRISSTCQSIKKIGCSGQSQKNVENIFHQSDQKQQNGIRVKKESNGIERTLKRVFISLKSIFANCASINIFAKLQPLPNSAVDFVMEDIEDTTCPSSTLDARHAIKNSKQNQIQLNQEIESSAHISVELQEVYNLTVEKYGVYYANGILVSNCDTAYDAVRLALIDKSVYSIRNSEDTQNKILSNLSNQFNRTVQAGKIRNAGSFQKIR